MTKRDASGPVAVTVTLMAPTDVGAPIRLKVTLDTHSASLDGINFQTAVAVRSVDGSDRHPTSVEVASGNGHHREAVLVFSAPTGVEPVTIVVKDVGGINVRVFTWDVPAGR